MAPKPIEEIFHKAMGEAQNSPNLTGRLRSVIRDRENSLTNPLFYKRLALFVLFLLLTMAILWLGVFFMGICISGAMSFAGLDIPLTARGLGEYLESFRVVRPIFPLMAELFQGLLLISFKIIIFIFPCVMFIQLKEEEPYENHY